LVHSDLYTHSRLDSLTTIVLDDSFNPSSRDAQEYLVGFCDKLFATGMAGPVNNEYQCPINKFDGWLRNQTSSSVQDQVYSTHCNSEDSLPMNDVDFVPCFVAWSKLTDENNVLNNQGVLKIMQIQYEMDIDGDSPFQVMDEFWNSFEEWMRSERENAPEGVNNMFQTARVFWLHDNNKSMLNTAIGAAMIALAFSAAVVLISSRSFALMAFLGLCVTYVLAVSLSIRDTSTQFFL